MPQPGAARAGDSGGRGDVAQPGTGPPPPLCQAARVGRSYSDFGSCCLYCLKRVWIVTAARSVGVYSAGLSRLHSGAGVPVGRRAEP